jgi:hypothetical protein
MLQCAYLLAYLKFTNQLTCSLQKLPRLLRASMACRCSIERSFEQPRS